MPNRILWRSATSKHDWTDMCFVRRLLDVAAKKEMVGQASWILVGDEDKREPIRIDEPELLYQCLLDHVPAKAPIYLECGGELPYPWSIIISVDPYLRKYKEVDGISYFWLFFDRALLTALGHSKELAEAFLAVHGPDNTEYAFIHPYYHWGDFADEHYRVPVTIGPMFKGIFWANFLGPGHLNEFDKEKLSTISAHQVKWINNRGLFLFITPDILTVQEPAAKAEMLRLTKLFSNALLPDSKWHP